MGRGAQEVKPSAGRELLHVFVLSGFAVAQPVYDLLGKHAEFFVARGSRPVDVLALVSVLSLLVPASLAGCLLLARALGGKLYAAVLTLLHVVLVAVIALPAARTQQPAVAAIVPIGCGLLFALAYRKLPAVRLFLSVLSPAVIVFPLVFVFATPVSKIAFPESVPQEAAAAISLTPESHVVFVIFDLLPVTALMDEDQNLDADRYPGFARLQARSVWYRRARTTSGATLRAIPALLSGRYRHEGAIAMLEDYPRNLFTLFGTAGDIHAFEPLTRLCPESLCRGSKSLSLSARLASLTRDTAIAFSHLVLPERLTVTLPPIDAQWGSFGAPADVPEDEPEEAVTERERRARLKKGLNELARQLQFQDRLKKFEIFADGLGGRASRNLSFLHLDLPHGPYLYLSSGKRYVPADEKYRRLRLGNALGRGSGKVGKKSWGPDRYLIDLAYQRLTHQIMLADELVGRLLDRLEEIGTFERSLIVIAADHGQGFEPHGPLRSDTHADTAHVPLFIKFPEQREGRVDDRAVETVDVLPTIIDTLGLSVAWQLDGYSLKLGSRGEAAVDQRDPPALDPDFATCLRRKLERVGSGSRQLPDPGPRPELVGQRIARILKGPGGGDVVRLRGVRLDQAALLKDVDVDSDFVPAYLTGSVKFPDGARAADLAIVVNGVVRATLTTYRTHEARPRFAALVPESSFVGGKNRWAVYRLKGDP